MIANTAAIGPVTRRQAIRFMSAAAVAQGGIGAIPPAPKAGAELRFDDLVRFEALAGATSIEEWVTRYLTKASGGLAAYIKTNGVSAADFERAIAERPKFFRALAGLRDRIRPQEAAILNAMGKVRELAPSTPQVPVFFFIGTAGPGATVKEVTSAGRELGLGILVPTEMVGMTSTTDMSEFSEGRCGRGDVSALPQLVAHEYAHVAQVQLQGLERYRSIYRQEGRNTHLAYAVREGAADLLAYLASGQLRERHHYMLANEASLWREFVRFLDQPVSSSTGWFSTPGGARCDRPAQLGYAIGYAISRHYYQAASDRGQALGEILSAVEPQDLLQIAAPYRAAMGG
jgi:hypothetical protein